MRAKTEFTRGKIAIITMVYTGAEKEDFRQTIEEQCQLLLEAAMERMPNDIAEQVVRNALVQPGLDEAVEVLTGEVIGDPSTYQPGPEEPAPQQRRPKVADETQTADTAAPAEKAPRGSKYDNFTFKTKVTDNWRRPGSHGAKTIQLILDNGGVITGRELVERGGRLVDVKWDLDKNPDKLEAVEG